MSILTHQALIRAIATARFIKDIILNETYINIEYADNAFGGNLVERPFLGLF